MEVKRLIEHWGVPLGIAAETGSLLVADAVRTAPPLRTTLAGSIDPAQAVYLCGVAGKAPRRLGLDKRVDTWYDELRTRDVGSSWITLPRDVYEPKRVAFNFFARLCYAQLLSHRPEGRELFTTVFWDTLNRRGVQKRWGLPDARTMRGSLACYPAVDIENLKQTIGMVGAVFTCELEGHKDLGSDGDRLIVATHAIGLFVGELTGLLAVFGKEGVPSATNLALHDA